MGVKRIRKPGVAFEDLPKIDLVLISHDHYDHLDLPTLTKIAQRDDPRILTGLGLKPFLEKHGIVKAVELDWWPGGNIAAFLPNINSLLKNSTGIKPSNQWPGRVFHLYVKLKEDIPCHLSILTPRIPRTVSFKVIFADKTTI